MKERQKKKVIIKIAARKPGDFALDLSYIITGASWKSIYQVRVESVDKKCVLVYQGLIRNMTGENWDNVNLTLSTAEPSKGGEPPKIPSLIVYVQDYPYYEPSTNTFFYDLIEQRANVEQSYSDYSYSSSDDELSDSFGMEKESKFKGELKPLSPRLKEKEYVKDRKKKKNIENPGMIHMMLIVII